MHLRWSYISQIYLFREIPNIKPINNHILNPPTAGYSPNPKFAILAKILQPINDYLTDFHRPYKWPNINKSIIFLNFIKPNLNSITASVVRI